VPEVAITALGRDPGDAVGNPANFSFHKALATAAVQLCGADHAAGTRLVRRTAPRGKLTVSNVALARNRQLTTSTAEIDHQNRSRGDSQR
jgi:hypothetical protein